LVPSWWWYWLLANSTTEPKSRTLSLRKGNLNQRPKSGDLRRSSYLLFGSFMVVVLASSQFHYRIKEQNTIPEEGTTSTRDMRLET